MKVFKYMIPHHDEFTLLLPKGAQLLHFDQQRGDPMLWALVDPDAPKEPRHFRFAGTGHEIDGPVKHIGSALFHGGSLVFHLFEVER